MPDRRLLVIGWDGADADVVRRLMDAGRLPNLQSLMHGGSWSTVDGYSGLGDDAHWSSFSTGLPPGRHGRFHFEQAPTGTYAQTMIQRDDPSLLPTFWSRLASRGLTASILDVPKSPYAPTPGVAEVVDWMPHGADSNDLSASCAELETLCSEHRPHGAFRECYGSAARDSAAQETHLQRVDERRAARTQALCEWVAARSDSLTVAIYASCHCVGHAYMHLHDASGTDPLSIELERLDADLDQVIRGWGGPPDDVVVISLTGMGPATTARLETEATVKALNRRWLQSNQQIGLISAAKHVKSRVLKRHNGPLPSADAFRSMKFVAPATAIRVNLQGRDPRGIVPADRFDDLLGWLTERLLELVDDNGEPVLGEVVRTASEFPGERHDALADLVAVWSNHHPGRVHTSITSVEAPKLPLADGVQGDHLPRWWMVSGPSLQVAADGIAVDQLGELFGYWLESAAPGSTDEPTTGSRLDIE